MAVEILYWHWLILGVLLLIAEIFLPTFTALWFGAGALLVGVLLLVFPDMSLTVQVVLWTVFSGVLTGLWFRYLKPLAVDRTKAGLSREAIVGEVGQVLSFQQELNRGQLRFPAPVLGSDEWQFICSEALAIGDRVRVVDISGNSLIVSPH